MKKTFLFISILLISFSTFAQKGDKGTGITYGVKAGLTFANVSGLNPSPSSITSFYGGGIVNIPINDMLSVQPGLTLIGKGFNQSVVLGGIVSTSYKYTPWYLEIPVNAIASFQAGPGKFFVGAGPYVAFGLFGQKQFMQTLPGSATNVTTNITYGTDLKTIDFGLNFLLGYQLTNGLSVNGGYSLGLTDISPSNSVKNSVFSVGLGFAF